MQRRHMTPNIDMQITSNESSTGREREGERGSRGAFEISWHCAHGKTAPDKKNREDRKKIYDTSTEARFLPCVHLLDQTHHSTAKHTNSRAMATRFRSQTAQRKMALATGMETSGLWLNVGLN